MRNSLKMDVLDELRLIVHSVKRDRAIPHFIRKNEPRFRFKSESEFESET
jgi:hypothetical protein